MLTNVLGMIHFEIFWENRPTLASEFVYPKVLLKNLRAEQDARHHMVKCNLERNICYTLLSTILIKKSSLPIPFTPDFYPDTSMKFEGLSALLIRFRK